MGAGMNMMTGLATETAARLGKALRPMVRLDLSAVSAISAAIAMLLMATTSPSQSGELLMDCAPDKLTDAATVSCDFRLTEPEQLEVLTLSANGKVLDGASFSAYPGIGEKSAWLYLIDRSNPNRAATVRRNIEIAGTQLRTASESRLVGLATFANDLDVVLEPAARHVNLDQTLNGIKADGAATELFANSLKAIEILKAVTADRKALVIMSDGKAEDTAYSRDDVVEAAGDAGVIIIGLGFAESTSETPSLQEIRRLAEETGGYFNSVVGKETFPADFAARLPRYLENGGRIKGPLGDISGDVETSLSVTVASGDVLTATQTIEIAGIAAEPEMPLSLIGKIYSIFDGIHADASDWANTNQALAWLLLLLPPLLIIALVLALRNRSVESVDDPFPADADPETPMTSRIDPIEGGNEDDSTRHFAVETDVSFGHFEIVGSEGHPFAIKAQSISIGRHSDNDLQLSNDSVHRHHAHFHISPGGDPTIHDLDTKNGLLVNGHRVETATLQSGDLIELGEVRLRYVAP